MASEYFDFKKFRVWHHQTAMKVGTDAVVLGCLVPLSAADKTVLDVGTGSGVIALMLAQKFAHSAITAIEIDVQAAQQAQNNFGSSIFSKQLVCVNQSLQDFAQVSQQKFDIIVSNPPFFEAHKNFSIPNQARGMARHDQALPFTDLAKYTAQLLHERGSFWLILPVAEARVFEEEAKNFGLNRIQEIAIIPKTGKAANRLVQSYQLRESQLVQTELILKNEQGLPSQDYILLSQDFYLRIDQ